MRPEMRRTRISPYVLTAITWLGVILFGGWLIWCAVYRFAGIPVEAEIVRTYEEHRRGRHGQKYTNTYGVVRYFDQNGRAQTDKLLVPAGTAPGRKIGVRYLPSQPDQCRRDSFWGIWGLASLSSGFFALFIGLAWFEQRTLRRRLRRLRQRNAFVQPTD